MTEAIIDNITLYSFNGKKEFELRGSGAWANFEIYEDLFSSFVSGQILIQDTFNNIETFPITGNESLHIKFRTGGLEDDINSTIDMEFAVYKISALTHIQGSQRGYFLHFVSKEAIMDSRIKISKSYNDLSSNIIRDILLNEIKTNKNIFVEESTYNQKIIVPNWTPFETCKWLCRRSISKKYSDASYEFFETTRGFHFKTFESLSDVDKPVVSFKTSDAYGSDTGIPDDDEDSDLNTFEEYGISRAYDTITNYSMGLLSSKLFSHDPINKTFKEFDYNYIDSYNDFVHLDKGQDKFICSSDVNEFGKRITDYPNACQYIYPTHTGLYDGGSGIVMKPDIWLQSRSSRIAQFSNWQIKAKVQGNSQLNVGMVVDVTLPDYTSKKVDEFPRLHNGHYIITAIRHFMTGDEYYTILELSKDCLSEPIRDAEIRT